MYGGLKALPMWQIIFGMKTLGQLRTVSYQKIQMHIFHVQVLDGMQKLSMSKRLFTKCSLHPAKNLQLGYSLPQKVLNKIGVQNLRVYVSGENLWTGTKLAEQFDPETVSGGSGGNAYPLSRTLSCGLSLTF